MSNVPIYTWNGAVPGVFGGRLLSTGLAAERTSQLALRVLRGERPEDIPITTIDGASMRSIGVSSTVGTSAKPASQQAWNSGFVNWGCSSRTRSYILVPSLGGAPDITDRGAADPAEKQAPCRASLRESEERFRVMADTAPVMVWRSGPDQGANSSTSRGWSFGDVACATRLAMAGRKAYTRTTCSVV